ncbi:MAG: right-handed parallel beta-helix repeat-containing protein [Methanomassiliicoccales archaeon]|nr:MAG: right-handed parallel beta-helix repeat-containing protein [Methanomassiliicoccales archaeon]
MTEGIQYKDAGLWIGSSGINFTDNQVSDCYNGITFYGASASNNIIQNNNFSFCDGNGTYVRLATDITIDNNEYYQNHQGMYFNTSSNVVVTNNDINDMNTYAALFYFVDGIEFNRNNISNLEEYQNRYYSAVFLMESFGGITADNNTLRNCGYHGLFASVYSDGFIVTNNTFYDYNFGAAFGVYSGDTAYFYGNSAGQDTIILSNKDSIAITAEKMTGHVDIINNTLYNAQQYWYTNRGIGIHLWDVPSATVRENVLMDNERAGVWVYDSSNLTVEYNQIENNEDYGIYFNEDINTLGGGVINALVNNNTVKNNIAGICTYKGANQTITNNTIDGNTDVGIIATVNETFIAHNTVTSNGEGETEQDGGIGIAANNVTLFNNTVKDNSAPASTYGSYGIFFQNSDNLLINECTIENNDNNVYSYQDATNILVENCTFNQDMFTLYDFYLLSNSHVTTLNTTFDNNSIYVDGTSNLTCKWYLNVKVRDSGIGVNGAEVWVNDSKDEPDPAMGQPFTTSNIDGDDGWIKWIPVTEFVWKGTSGGARDDHTPHWINATYTNMRGIRLPKMWISQDVIVDLSTPPVVEDLEPSFPTAKRTWGMYIYANAIDDKDSEDILTAFLEYRDPNELSWNTTYIEYQNYVGGAPPSGYWQFLFGPPADAPLGLYDLRVKFNDTDLCFSDWTYAMDSLEVVNCPPEVLNIIPDGSMVFRGDSINICSDGYDGDGEDLFENENWDAQIEFRLNGAAFYVTANETATITASYYDPGSEHWIFTFWTNGTRPEPALGPVDFRMRFQDPDGIWGGWYFGLDLIPIVNCIPEASDLTAEDTEVFQGQPVWIYANGTDVEENEENLTVEFYYDIPNGTPLWVQDWLGTPEYVDTDLDPNNDIGYWRVLFSPPASADIGYYDFKVYINDSDGDAEEVIEGALVNVINSLPIAIDIIPSKPYVRPDETIFIHVNASDFEDDEDTLTLTVEWRYNETTPGTWESTNISIESYYGIPDSGWLRVSFKPNSSFLEGHYDFRAMVTDTDGNDSAEWIYMYRAVQVLSTVPTIEDMSLGATEVLRNDTLYIFINATDENDFESELTPHLQYLAPGESWTDIPSSNIYYDDINGDPTDDIGYWVIMFTPDCSEPLGDYQFQVRVNNTSGGYSNGGSWTQLGNTAEVMDNYPEAIDLRAEQSTVDRGSSVFIYADGFDEEQDEDSLTVYFQYRPQGGEWNVTYLSAKTYDIGSDSWRITFSPPADKDFPVGLYDFRVWFEDQEGNISEILLITEMIEVLNVHPSVDDIDGPSSGYRFELFNLTANGTDLENTEAELTPIFQYKSPTGDWTGYGDAGSFLQNPPQYINGYWKIEFCPLSDAPFGLYSFRVRFSDGLNNSQWMTLTDCFTLERKGLEVDNLTVPPSGYRMETITITANATDPGGSESALTATFEYKGPTGGWISQGAPGGYFVGPPQYIDDCWQIEFYPPGDADAGDYSFQVQFFNGTNTTEWLTKLDSFTLLNRIPEVIDLIVPSSGHRLETIYITANGSDNDGTEASLTPTFQYQGPTGTWTGFGEPGSYFTSSHQYFNGYWRIAFRAPSDAEIGDYSFRVCFFDGDNTSSWRTLLNSMTLTNIIPEVDDLKNPSSGYRLETIRISANVTDNDGSEQNLIPTFQYKGPSGGWISQGDTGSYFADSAQYINGIWIIEFIAPADAEVGLYSFRVQFSDDNDTCDWTTNGNSFTLMNNEPEVEDLTVPSSGYRLETIYISANGIDGDKAEGSLTPTFEYKEPGGNWKAYDDQGSYFTGPPEYLSGQWKIVFQVPTDGAMGQYGFRVRFSDGTDTSDWTTKENSFTLQNTAPEVDSFTIPSSSNRLEAFYITAEATDLDDDDLTLVPNFQYKGPDDSDWVSFGDTGSYFTGSWEYNNGLWRIEFNPPADSTPGKYSFRVQFSDGHATSSWETKMNAFTLNNNEPSVEISSPSPGDQTTATFTFSAAASDVEGSTLTYQWDFGDGSPFSSEKSPSHTYTSPGTYNINLTVTDGEGGKTVDTITIVIPLNAIPKEPGADEGEPESDWITSILLLAIISLIVLVLLILLYKRKKGGEELPKEEEPLEGVPFVEEPETATEEVPEPESPGESSTEPPQTSEEVTSESISKTPSEDTVSSPEQSETLGPGPSKKDDKNKLPPPPPPPPPPV